MEENTPTLSEILTARFDALIATNPSERRALERICARPTARHNAETALWREGDPTRAPTLIAAGWACASRTLAAGGRQIIELLLPGDLLAFSEAHRPSALATIQALTTVHTLEVPEFETVWHDPNLDSRMAMRLDRMLHEQQFFLFSQIARVGRSSAYVRLANLLCELNWRLGRRRLAEDGRFHMPLTQKHIADTLGLTPVHVNRTFNKMRAEKVVEFERGQVWLLDAQQLADKSGFAAPA